MKDLISFRNGKTSCKWPQGIFFGAGLAFLSLNVAATQQVVVNEASIAVSDQSQTTQTNALKKALRQVVIKISGNTDVLENPGIKAALVSPQSYLRSYRFAFEEQETYYVAEFDKTKLTDLLKRERLPLWGERRPETIVWMATENDVGERFIIDEGHLSAESEMLTTTADMRGVPLSLPLMDLTDSSTISVYDVWGRFVQSLTQASTRYGVDNVIGARLYKNTAGSVPSFPEQRQNVDLPAAPTEAPDEAVLEYNEVETLNDENDVQIAVDDSNLPPFSMDEFAQHAKRANEGDYALDWVFIGGGNVSYGSIFADNPASLTQELVDAYANYLSTQYAVIPGAINEERLEIAVSIANVDSLTKYAHVTNYLNSLSVIETAMLINQAGSVATYVLSLVGTPDDLLNTVQLESKLQPVTDAYGQVVEGYTFYWNE